MRKIFYSFTLFLSMMAYQPVNSQSNEIIEKEVQALAAELRKAWDNRDLDGYLACFSDNPEGIFIVGGEKRIKDTMRVRTQFYWKNRANESWKNVGVQVIPLSENSALLQSTTTGRYTWIPTGVTWEFNASMFSTSLVKKINGKWKIVAHHNSGEGKQVPE